MRPLSYRYSKCDPHQAVNQAGPDTLRNLYSSATLYNRQTIHYHVTSAREPGPMRSLLYRQISRKPCTCIVL